MPVEISIDGEDGDELYKRALEHIVGLEIGEGPVIAKEVRVKVGDKEMSWDEFASEMASV